MAEKGEETELVRCPVCYGEAKVVLFGHENKGVWVGCNFSPECARYIEYHKEGWSIAETKAEWNRKNSGIRGVFRRLKIWFRLYGYGRRKEEKEWEKKEKAKGKKRKAERKAAIRCMLAAQRAKKWNETGLMGK